MKNNFIGSGLLPEISACMIVKNEEKFLAQCLGSIKEYVDEIIIVDTGSIDKTVEIAESFGARVYHHPWENHFSKHRNQSFGYSKKDWIFYIDADEELLPGSGELLLESISETENDVDAIAVTLECIFNEGRSMSYNNAVRLFRNHRGFYYKGRVHNYIVGVKKVLCCPIRLFHHGYNLDKQTMASKFERTTKLLKLDINDDPDDPRPHHFLAASYLSEHMHEEALKEALVSISLAEKKIEFSHNYFWSIYIAASACLNLGKPDMAKDLAEKGIRLFRDHLDSYYILCLIAYEKRDSRLFDRHFQNFVRVRKNYHKNPEKFGEIVNNTIGSQWFLHLLKAFLLFDQGADKDTENEIAAAKNLCPDLYLLYMRLGDYYIKKNRICDAENIYLQAVEKRPDSLQAIKILGGIYKQLGKESEQMDLLEKAVKINNSDLECLFSLGLIYMKRDKPEKALSIFNDADKITNDTKITINRAICLRELNRFKEVESLLKDLHSEDDSLNKIILSNLAYSFYVTGNITEAIHYLEKLKNIDEMDTYPSILLSRIYLDQMEFDPLVMECGSLLHILGIKETCSINSIEDLAECYLCAAKKLLNINKTRQYIQECLEISLILSGETPSLIADIGSIFISIGLIKKGTEILKKAIFLSPSDKVLLEHVKNILNTINSNTFPGDDPAAP